MDKHHVISVRVSIAELKEVDSRRKNMTRSEYVRKVIVQDLDNYDNKRYQKNILKFSANSAFMLRYLSTVLGQKELVFEAKKTTDEWLAKNLFDDDE